MPLDEDALLKSQSEIVADMVTEWQSAMPDVWLGEDGVLMMLLMMFGGQTESLYMANQILREDSFIQTASVQALELYGDMYGVGRKGGQQATGQVKFTGAAGTYIEIGSEVAYDPGTGEDTILVYETIEDGTIPSPGDPGAPTVALGAVGNPNATYEYAVSFVTLEGETLIGTVSAPIVATLDIVELTAIPVGGAGVTARRIYRRNVGADFHRLTEITNNVATTFSDNATDASISGNAAPSATNTALAIQLDAIAEEPGVVFNVVAFSITELNDVADGITAVTNTTSFSDGTDEEDSEVYRTRLLNHLRAPGTGSPADLEAWAEEIEGVEDATAFRNDNLGTPTNGHTTVRISGPGGTVPGAPVLAAVLANLEERDIANAIIHVAAFDAVPTDVEVTLDLEDGFILANVSPSVEGAIITFINTLPVGGMFRLNELIAALIHLPGVLDLVIDDPVTDLATAADEKRTPDTITVN